MRTYIVYYYKEINDECVEQQIEIQCNNIEMALHLFKQEIRIYKRVYKIEEKVLWDAKE